MDSTVSLVRMNKLLLKLFLLKNSFPLYLILNTNWYYHHDNKEQKSRKSRPMNLVQLTCPVTLQTWDHLRLPR